jgi:UDP-N-acetylmuramyl pentapeptide phosphotransferase/UDP-N-acetylglucosamine-1-phosphate transferase
VILALQLAVFAAACGALTWAFTRVLIDVLTKKRVLDRPNARSSHTAPVPRGGGIAVVAVALPAWALVSALSSERPATLAVVLAGALGLALLSWGDDRGGLPVALRLGAQAVVIAVVFTMAPGRWELFGDLLPAWAGMAILGLAWIWFINLFNFMDGIDGIAGGEAASIGLGLAVVAAVAGLDWPLAAKGVAIAGTAIGFLCWNWQPARIFLGDVGSIPLGYLLGWLLLELAQAGQWAAALLLPLYFLADATLTLLRRAARLEKIWQPHRSHFYQRALVAEERPNGLSHAQVASRVILTNLILILAAAATAAGWIFTGLGMGFGAVAVLLVVLARAGAR